MEWGKLGLNHLVPGWSILSVLLGSPWVELGLGAGGGIVISFGLMAATSEAVKFCFSPQTVFRSSELLL